MKIYIFISIVFLLFIKNTSTQVTQEWIAKFNGPGNYQEHAYAMTIDDTGNVYVTGYSPYNSNSNYDIVTVKYNTSGIQQWLRRFNGSGNYTDIGYAIALDLSGNIYVGGCCTVNGPTYDYVLIKYNSAGLQQWIRTYNGPGSKDDMINSLVVDNTGNIYVTGWSWGVGTNNTDFSTIKYNSAGEQIWIQRYDGIENSLDGGISLAVDKTGNVYATGYSFTITNSDDYTTIKYNSSGVQQWVQTYNGTGNFSDVVSAIELDSSGNIYISGKSYGRETGTDFATVKYNSAGVQQWVQRFNGEGNMNDRVFDLKLDKESNVLVTGCSIGSGIGEDFTTIKYNSSGIQQWVSIYNGEQNTADIARSIAIDSSGNVYITGQSGYEPYFDFATLKYNSSGLQQWVIKYNGSIQGIDIPNVIAVDRVGNVYVTGYSTDSFTTEDYTTIKYSQPIGINNISREIPEKFDIHQNYPNPFNPSTIIQYDLPENATVKLVIYDMLGREVARLVNGEEQKAGSYEAEFDGTNLASGVYFYKLESEAFSEMKKMVLLK